MLAHFEAGVVNREEDITLLVTVEYPVFCAVQDKHVAVTPYVLGMFRNEESLNG